MLKQHSTCRHLHYLKANGIMSTQEKGGDKMSGNKCKVFDMTDKSAADSTSVSAQKDR